MAVIMRWKVATDTAETRGLLAVLGSSADFDSLRGMLPGWEVRLAQSLDEAREALRSSSIGVIICDRCIGGGRCWQELLSDLQSMRFAPQLIIADERADEMLWAEVLNLGCYDLLMRPFRTDEVHRVAPMAWESWRRDMERRRGPEASRPEMARQPL